MKGGKYEYFRLDLGFLDIRRAKGLSSKSYLSTLCSQTPQLRLINNFSRLKVYTATIHGLISIILSMNHGSIYPLFLSNLI